LQAIAISNGISTFGKFLVVMPTTNPNYDRIAEIVTPDNDGVVRLYETLNEAYAAATTNANDVILLSAHSTHTLTAPIAWTKSRIQVIGLDGGNRLVQQGSKVSTSATEATAGYVIKVTGVRNSFKNIKFIQASTNAAGLHVLELGGEGNLFENCSATFGVDDNLDSTTATEVVLGEDSGTFINCLFGQDTLVSSATTRSIMVIDEVTSGQPCKSNIFKDCTWLGASYQWLLLEIYYSQIIS